MTYSILRNERDDTLVFVSDIPDGLERKFELVKGMSRIDGWPDDMTLKFSKMSPEGIVLSDFIFNAFSWLLVSTTFKTLLEEIGVPHIEFLPVRINNHKGAIASKAYWIANVLELTSVVDRDQSDYDQDEDEPEAIEFDDIDRLVLLDEVVANGPAVIRVTEDPRVVLLRSDVVDTVEAGGLTGMRFIPTDEFSG